MGLCDDELIRRSTCKRNHEIRKRSISKESLITNLNLNVPDDEPNTAVLSEIEKEGDTEQTPRKLKKKVHRKKKQNNENEPKQQVEQEPPSDTQLNRRSLRVNELREVKE